MFAKWNKTPIDNTMLDALGIYELAKKRYYQLSTGQKRRLHLALALTRNPDILFLDEPTAGLDIEGRLSLHKQIRHLKAMKKTIILASHDMTEVESLCDRIAILSKGRIAFIGTVDQLNKTVGKHYNITIQTQDKIKKYECDDIEAALFPLLLMQYKNNETILDIQINRGSLEQHFMKNRKGGLLNGRIFICNFYNEIRHTEQNNTHNLLHCSSPFLRSWAKYSLLLCRSQNTHLFNR